MAADVWLFHLTEHTSKKITDWEGTDTLPMWQGKQVYYLSDAGPAHRLNIWRYDRETETRAQVTHFKAYDVKWPSNGPGTQGQGEIIFENNGRLYLLNLVQSRHLSPQAKRVLVQARGDVWSLSAQEGTPRNLTRPARMNWSCGPQTGAVRPKG